MKKRLLTLFLVCSFVAIASVSYSETIKPNFISIGTAPTGASFYPMGVAIAKIIKDYVPGINASAVPTGGSKENINLLVKNEIQLGFVVSPGAYEAVNSLGEYAKFKSAPVQVVFCGHFGPWTLVARKDSGIKSYADLKGKKIIADMPRADANLKAFDSVISNYGLTLSDIDVLKLLSIGNAIQQVKDKRADGVFYIVTPGSAVFLDLTKNVQTSWPSISDGIMDKVIKEHPYYSKYTFPAKMFTGQDAPVNAIGSTILICTRKDIDPDVVYKITKAVFEHTDILQKAHPVGRQYNLKRATSLRVIPFHPGAIKYYKEKGTW